MATKDGFSRARGREFLAVHDGFSASWGAEAQDFPLQRQKFPGRPRSREPAVEIFGFGKTLGGSVQGAESLVNQGEERFERISRAEFNVDTPDADRQAGGNFKESQTNLADRGSFEFGAP